MRCTDGRLLNAQVPIGIKPKPRFDSSVPLFDSLPPRHINLARKTQARCYLRGRIDQWLPYSSFEPVDYYLWFQLLEFLIAGNEVCLSLFRQRRSEAIGKRHFVLSFKPSGVVSNFPVGVNHLYS